MKRTKQTKQQVIKEWKKRQEAETRESQALATIISQVPTFIFHHILDCMVSCQWKYQNPGVGSTTLVNTGFYPPHYFIQALGSFSRSCRLFNSVVQTYPPYMAMSAICWSVRRGIANRYYWQNAFRYYVKRGYAEPQRVSNAKRKAKVEPKRIG
jgi:hypothetical protein